MHASVLYATIETVPAALCKPPVQKSYQSFDCGGTKSTIYYYEYPSKRDADGAKAYSKGALWGDKGHPTKKNPEIIVTQDNVLIVISSPDPEPFESYFAKAP